MAMKWTPERTSRLLLLKLVNDDKSISIRTVNGRTLDRAVLARQSPAKALETLWRHYYQDDSYQPKDRGIQLHMRHLKESMSADGTATTSGDGEAPVTPQKRKMPVGTNIGSTGKRARKEVAPKEHDSESDEAADATPITPRTPSSRRSKAKVKSYRITASLSSDDSDNDDTNEDGPIANKPAFGKATTRSREPHGAPSREAKNIKPAHSIKLDAEDESDSLAEQTETGMGMEDDSDASEYRPT